MIEVGLLGSIVVQVDDERVDLTGVLEKALLARLSIHPGTTVSQERLIDDLWGEAPPNNAVGSLQTLVYRLRKALGPAGSAISRADNGYRLETPPERVDAAKFDLLVERARREPKTTQSIGRELLTEALGLWRGTAFEGLDSVPFVAARRVGLEAARMAALEGRIAADLNAGAGGELVAELEGLVTEHPFNESLWGHLIIALYRSGSQAAALRCYERVRVLLDEELGLTPSPALAAPRKCRSDAGPFVACDRSRDRTARHTRECRATRKGTRGGDDPCHQCGGIWPTSGERPRQRWQR